MFSEYHDNRDPNFVLIFNNINKATVRIFDVGATLAIIIVIF